VAQLPEINMLKGSTQRLSEIHRTGSLYQKIYWELLPKEILGAITQRDTGSYYPKRDWDVLWENGERGDKEVTMQYLELKRGDRGACKLLGDVIEVLGCLLRCLLLKMGKNEVKGVSRPVPLPLAAGALLQ
ncbi:hypothetical protein Tco_1531690, partial [Tanacetum coccineum]